MTLIRHHRALFGTLRTPGGSDSLITKRLPLKFNDR
ncbi:hypothetical protein JOE60_002251 [Paenarthrobacter ilicis]|nr:hypothetical protein [Paenarthrobacter ilicis]